MTFNNRADAPARQSSRAASPSSEVPAKRSASRRSLIVAGWVLGIAMSGFFDGILLHQVLQWHHLLSLAPGEAFGDPRVQVYADGMFHVLMYGLLLIGLWFLWRERQAMGAANGGRSVVLAFIAGFGAWNVADVVGFHWLLRWHNIRLDVPNPIAWDVGWLVVLGLAPLALAALLRRGAPPTVNPKHAALVLAVLTLGAGAVNLNAGPSSGNVAVLFRPGMSEPDRIVAVAQVGGRMVATDHSGDLMIISVDARAQLWKLYGDGALVVGRTPGGGCLNATTVIADRVIEAPRDGTLTG